jgi:CO dehydrogenase maturation factor
MKSIDTASRVIKLAKEIDIPNIIAVGNKISNSEEKEFIKEKMGLLNLPVAAYIPLDPVVAEADMKGIPLLDYDEKSSVVEAIKGLKDYLKKQYTF